MIDATLTRMRCRATREIRTSQGLIRCSTEGVIQCEMDNLGRHLIQVQWDSGVTDYACPSEIEILGQEAVLPQPAKIESVSTGTGV
jgi:hypothetical protein